MINAHLFSLGTAVPPYQLHQGDIAYNMASLFQFKEEEIEQLKKLYASTAIAKRHSVVEDFVHPQHRSFWGKDFPNKVPGMTDRNEFYKQHAPALALDACKQALENWGGNLKEITHVIAVSCTGLMAPGIEFQLVEQLGLLASTQRFGVNFMGCFGAFKALAVAQGFASMNPKNRILIVCVELCSLHLQVESSMTQMLGNALFADGAAAAVVGCDPSSFEKPLWQISHSSSLALPNCQDKMTWYPTDHGMKMYLSPYVPAYVSKTITSFIELILPKDASYRDYLWAVHPGGKSILQAVERALGLEEWQTEASWETLKNYGNMSSATFLFVLQQLQSSNRKLPIVGIGFGPGLSMEGVVLKQIEKALS